MPFANSHRWLFLLVPMIALAFGPNYVGQFHDAPLAMHFHGGIASVWIALVGYQTWSANNGRLAAHRLAGKAVFVLTPIFAAASLLMIQREVYLGIAQADPFHAQFTVRLAPEDLLSLAAFLLLVHRALARRRRMREHAAAMWATVLLVLPPVLGRLLGMVTLLPARAIGVHPFWPAFELAQLVTVALCVFVARRVGGSGRAFLFVAGTLIGESLLFETAARTAQWRAIAIDFAGVPTLMMSTAGLLLGVLAVWAGWTATRRDLSRAGAGIGSATQRAPLRQG